MPVFKTNHPGTEDFVLNESRILTQPNLSYDFIPLILKTNFTDKSLVNYFNISSRNFETIVLSNVLVNVTNPDVEQLEFWFENERGDLIENKLGKTIIHLRFNRERI